MSKQMVDIGYNAPKMPLDRVPKTNIIERIIDIAVADALN